MPRAICRDACLLAAKCSNSATLPGRGGGESWGLVVTQCNVILLQYDPPPPRGRSPSVTGPFAVAAAAFRAQAPGACRGLDRADLGRGAVGYPMTSSAISALRFHDLTLGYDRHPAVHHLDGVVEQGSLTAVVGPNGAGKSTLFKAVVGALKPLSGSIERGGFAARDIAYLPQAAEIDRSFPINVYDMVAMGLWRRKGPFGGIARRDRTGPRRGRPDRLRRAQHRHAVGRPDAAHAVRPLAGSRLARDRARRAVQRHRQQDGGRPDALGAAVALGAPHRAGRHPRYRAGARVFSANFAARPRAGGLGRNARGADGREPRSSAPHVRGVRRGRRGLRQRGRVNLLILAMLYDTLIAPFAEHDFMRRALAATFALSFSAAPIGVFLMLRRMSLIGDALSHAILPGVAIGFLLAGMSVLAMAAGGLIAGFLITIGAGLIARATTLKEDASLAAFFLISLALGVTIVSLKGSNEDLVHFLFGSVLTIQNTSLLLIAAIASVSLIALALIWRPLVLECVDPGFLRSVSRSGSLAHVAFLALTVLNLVGGFLVLGTLLAVGIMMLPAFIARFWARDVTGMIAVAIASAALSGYAGLVLSYRAGLPAGPAIILVAGALYILSVVVGPVGGLVWLVLPRRHLEA